MLLILSVVALKSCVPPGETTFEGVVVDLNDPVTRRIYTHQNDRNVDSLLVYLEADEPSYRYQAARAFGSFPKLPASARTRLVAVLGDRNPLVRTAGAYALGQTGTEEAAQDLAASFDTLGVYDEYNGELLMAIGKTAPAATQTQVTNITTYRPVDTTLRAAQVWSLFYFARRGIRSDRGDSIALAHLLSEETPMPVLEPAAFYLQRFPVTLTANQEQAMRGLLRSSTNSDVLMAAVRTLGETGAAPSRVALLRALANQPDWRVRIEILKALGTYDYTLVRQNVLERLSDEHPLVRRQAATYLLDHGDASDATYYHRFAKDSTRTDIRYTLYGAANRYLPLYLTDYRGRINYDLQQAFAATEDVQQKAAILQSLAEFPWNYRTIYDLYVETGSPAVRSAAAEALHTISSREDFNEYFRGSAPRVRLDLASFFQEMITTLAVGPAYHAAEAIAERSEVYRPLYPDRTWLRSAINAFKLPKEIEAYYAVDAARAALAGEPAPKPKQPDSNVRAIDWDLLGEADQTVQVRTDVGRFTLKMLPDIAPASVSNFLALAEDQYYDGKVFHRVVPNFVAQGGGPLGDGFGAENYSLRTETPNVRWDRTGLVGMASAGKDTEGVQFFITHRPTPHLDGNYTIFAEVTEGQEVIDQITVGTKIESITIR
ncbi:peptidylprolyl isomerase [Lewinella sp. 4G2]|uniref:peptidylprolyl isomerase n=1 Tax=Lewinella sp. 4G2 TaxID=1803372 RepID=UPI0018D47090|nr:peptidylprolyl isomerase [Lewinella sp. 4G2]